MYSVVTNKACFLLYIATILTNAAEETSTEDRDKRGTYGTTEYNSGRGTYAGRYAANNIQASAIAQQAAFRAKVVEQNTAAKSSLLIKLRLAQKAQHAHVAVTAKEAFVQRIKQQLYQIEAQVELEAAQAAEAQQSAAAAQKLVHECEQQIQALTAALHMAKANAARATRAAQIAEEEALVQSQVLYEARQRARLLEVKLQAAEADLDAAQHAAHKASAAAQIVKENCCDLEEEEEK